MTPSRVFRNVSSAGGWLGAVLALVVLLLCDTLAHADNFDELKLQLERGDSDKVRLSAAINLTKLGDPRAIPALAKAVGNDADKTVRGAAAVGLGKLVTDKTKTSVRNLAITVLKQAAANDDAEFVRKQADEALHSIDGGASIGPVTTTQPAGAIYVNIGPMSAKTGDAAIDAKLQALMVKVANKTMVRAASSMATTWPGGPPSKKALDAKSTVGFYVDGTLNEVKVKQSGSSTMVSCKINMLLASYPDKSIFGLLNGGASVQATGTATDVALAEQDCVSAVVEDLIAKKIVPTINSKAGTP